MKRVKGVIVAEVYGSRAVYDSNIQRNDYKNLDGQKIIGTWDDIIMKLFKLRKINPLIGVKLAQSDIPVLLWLDDVRDPHTNDWLNFSPIREPYHVVWVKKYHEFVYWISNYGLPKAICFDHDLGDIHISKSTYHEKNGYDCAKWLVNYCLDNKLPLPLWNVQSSNPIGRENINRYLKNYQIFNKV